MNRKHFQMGLLVLVFLVPPLLSYFLFFSGYRPEGSVNHGQLVTPARPVESDAGMTTVDGEGFRFSGLPKKWTLFYLGGSGCDALCGESLYKISTLMGNSPEICRRHYATLLPESLIQSVEFDDEEKPAGESPHVSRSGRPHLKLIVNNDSVRFGGGATVYQGSPEIVNCTFSGNDTVYGGALCNQTSATPAVTNCVFWGDTATVGAEIYDSSSTPVVTYSDIAGGYAGTGNIDADPLFTGGGSYALLRQHCVAGGPIQRAIHDRFHLRLLQSPSPEASPQMTGADRI